MKNLIITSTLALIISAWNMVGAQDYPAEYLGLPGDNLNLYATMKLFQESETLESFEKSLNDENSRINNLDLNGDNMVDYIMVIDYVDGDVHSIVLRAALNKDETQDVAVFTVQRFKNGAVQIQLVGDEALYGRNYIVEPIYADNQLETPNPGYSGNNGNVAVVRTTTFEIAAWPVVRYIYLPGYVRWHSSWYWDYYPSYWNPWRPFYYHTYYGYHYNMHNYYYGHYRTCNYYRYNHYNNFYYSKIRTYSPRVSAGIRHGNYRSTYSRPDLRKKGEALYARRNSGSNARTRDNASVRSGRINNSRSTKNSSVEGTRSGSERSSSTNVKRRSVSGAKVNTGTVNSRKSATVGSIRNAENNSVRKRSDNLRRESTNVSARVKTNPSANRLTNSTRKSGDVGSKRTIRSSSVGQKNGYVQRSSANVSRKNVSRTQKAPRSISSRNSSGHSQTKSAVSSGRSGSQSRAAVSSGRSGSSSRSSGGRSSNARTSSNRTSGRR